MLNGSNNARRSCSAERVDVIIDILVRWAVIVLRFQKEKAFSVSVTVLYDLMGKRKKRSYVPF